MAKKLRFTQVKGLVGCTKTQMDSVRSLGLKRIHDVVIKDDRPEYRGMANAVPHLVTVEEVDEQ
ncbi:MAG: 50S ribosomal protein L30 [Candidatus Nanopelagicales bacterium]